MLESPEEHNTNDDDDEIEDAVMREGDVVEEIEEFVVLEDGKFHVRPIPDSTC